MDIRNSKKGRASSPGPDPTAVSPSGASEDLHLAPATAVPMHRLLADNVPDVVYALDQSGVIIALNKAITQYGYTLAELIGKKFTDLIHIEDRNRVAGRYLEIVTQKESRSHIQQFRFVSKSGEIRWLEAHGSIQFDSQSRFMFQQGACRDITEIVESRRSPDKTRTELEALVKLRTAELTQANADLQREILERRETERILKEHEVDLEMEKGNLEETNTALKVLLKRREVDKQEFEEQVMCNIKEFVLPYLDKLKELAVDERQQAYVSILESNLSDVTSAFSRRLSLDYYNLTPAERKTANFIRQGKKTREISSLLGLSPRTVEAYRLNIRNKLRIQNQKVNLRTFLLSVS
ncbi:MAG: PAS domain S-box protein [Desulfobacteraceae bacterium]|jgi:PAS domain S-box-containing protein